MRRSNDHNTQGMCTCSGRYMRPLVRELSDFSRDGSYDFSGSADLQQAAADGNAAPSSPPKEDPNEPEAAKVRTSLEVLSTCQ